VDRASHTQAVRNRYGVPDALRLRVDRAEVLAFLASDEVAVRRVAADPDALPDAGLGGRAPLSRIAGARGPLLVRPYRKGGLLRHVRGRLFRGSWRPLSELVLHRQLAAAGVPVAEAVGCVVQRRLSGWRGFLLTREEEGACDLEAWLYAGPQRGKFAPAGVLQRAGRAVRRLHDAGVSHPDLHPKNLLLLRSGDVLLIDLDRAPLSPGPLPEPQRLANLARLGRAIEKHRLRGLRVGRRQVLRFLEGYAGSPAAAHAWLERVRARVRRHLWLRRLWWKLSGATRTAAAAGRDGPFEEAVS